jgi:hypothetical protein
MTSPARRHLERVSAEIAAKASGAAMMAGIAPAIDESNPAANEYRVLLASLHEDIRQISDIHSHDARKPVKLEKAVTYRPWVEGALAAGAAGAATQDEIVAEMLTVSACPNASPAHRSRPLSLPRLPRHYCPLAVT